MPTLNNAHGLVIGIAHYGSVTPLPDAVLNDAERVHAALINPAICGYPVENVTLLLDGDATLSAVRAALAGLAAQTDVDSNAFIYISSHGGRIAQGPDAGEYVLPFDVATIENAGDLQIDSTTALSGTVLTAALRAIPARKLLVVLDLCHAGGVGQPKSTLTPGFKLGLPTAYYEQLGQGRGRAILAAARGDEYSYVLPGDANSLFTKHLLAGLYGGVASDDGQIRIFNLFEYVQPKVTAEHSHQHPIFKAELEENFPVALYLGGAKGVVPRVDAGFRYDAYISYVDRPPDNDWVWEMLVPRLADAGLRVAVSGDVEEPGVARVVNIERGIRQAKRTVVVLTDAYLDDNTAEFENVMAQTMGIQEGTYRVLPVYLADVDRTRIPTRLGMLSAVDMGHPRRAAQEFDRLVRALHGPLPVANIVDSRCVRRLQ